jgi:hypothetical protein
MWRITTVPILQTNSLEATRHSSKLASRAGWRGLGLLAMSLLFAAAACAAPAEGPRETVRKLVAQIQRADYEGNRAALENLYADLEPFNADLKLASRARYWRGFALWRRAINGFNDSADPKDLEHDLTQAISEFKESAAKDPAFVDAKVGTISCLGNLMYLALGHADRVQELLAQSIPIVKEVRASHPDNPRFVWVFGPHSLEHSRGARRRPGQSNRVLPEGPGIGAQAQGHGHRSSRAVLGRAGAAHEPRVVQPESSHAQRERRGPVRAFCARARPLLALRPRHPPAPNPNRKSCGEALSSAPPVPFDKFSTLYRLVSPCPA